MRSRLLLLRRAGARKLLRTFTQSTAVRTDLRARPQLPFLSVPSTRTRVRYLTTERKAQLKYEIKTGIKYTGYIWIAGAALLAAWFAIVQERLERRYPTPHEWRFRTRMDLRGGNCARYEPLPGKLTDWLQVGWWFETTIARLHDPKIDGQGVKDAPHDCPPGTKDVTAKSEEWRRGYFEAMMGYAKAAEYMDGWVLDKSRNIVFPPGVMIGPSNPFPKPLPPGYKGAPREEDCELRFDPPDAIYLRILCTPGFTNRQRIEAGLAYASWLEYKGIAGPASIVYEDAVRLAASERPNLPAEPLDKKTWVLNDAAGPPSENLLTSLTAYATFRARQGDVSSALPILVSILQARRSLPEPEQPAPAPASLAAALNTTAPNKKTSTTSNPWSLLTKLFTPPAYPPPPPDGTAPPVRDPLDLCQEAALSLHIGEILYATAASPAGREEGLGWTREAVDVAEEQLHRLPPRRTEKPDPARAACRECLATGLGNWSAMVARLAREERARKEAAAAAAAAAGQKAGKRSAGWFGGLAEEKEETSRWAAEEKVIEERQKRVQDLLEDLKPPPRGILSFLQA
ncbi:df1ceb1d-2165-4280-a6d6-fdb0cb621d6f [Thermothielavioides terrestris]|uniref:Df1ceb1d-2165-4280-a6d6-fdb0cb621d6f n=1 Tax=Thermothielavioides terrestris TaxID=2587410 RepID=A0A446B985_9PEZI|nr:df1ceb1d-2165-4280-a6d6-fdb0cb621d6f [Thermothielavioides terrestris]